MGDEAKTSEQVAAEAAAAATAAGDQGAGKTAEELQAEIDKMRPALSAANREAETRRKRIAELEAAETARTQAEMTELDRLKAENLELQATAKQERDNARQTLIRAAFVAEAARAGIAHPEDVFLLADRSAVEVDDEKATVSGVEEAVKLLIDAGRVVMSDGGKPRAPRLDGGAGGGTGGSGHGGQTVKLTEDEIQTAKRFGITPERYAAQKAALSQED
jgi:hypothetical protein